MKPGVFSMLATMALTMFALSLYAAEKGHAEKKEKVKIPGTLPAIWTAVQKERAALDAVIKAKNLKDVHHHAFAIRDLVNAMPGKSKMLSADDKKKLDKGVKTVAKLAADLDDAGDSNNQAKTEAGQKKLETVLKAIEAVYPKGALKAPAQKK